MKSGPLCLLVILMLSQSSWITAFLMDVLGSEHIFKVLDAMLIGAQLASAPQNSTGSSGLTSVSTQGASLQTCHTADGSMQLALNERAGYVLGTKACHQSGSPWAYALQVTGWLCPHSLLQLQVMTKMSAALKGEGWPWTRMLQDACLGKCPPYEVCDVFSVPRAARLGCEGVRFGPQGQQAGCLVPSRFPDHQQLYQKNRQHNDTSL